MFFFLVRIVKTTQNLCYFSYSVKRRNERPPHSVIWIVKLKLYFYWPSYTRHWVHFTVLLQSRFWHRTNKATIKSFQILQNPTARLNNESASTHLYSWRTEYIDAWPADPLHWYIIHHLWVKLFSISHSTWQRQKHLNRRCTPELI